MFSEAGDAFGTLLADGIDTMHVDPVDQRRAFRANGFALLIFGIVAFLLPFAAPALITGLPIEWRGVATFGCILGGWIACGWGGGLYACSKGYSGFWGLVMIPALPIAGFAVLYFLTDRWSPAKRRWLPEGNRRLVGSQSFDSEWEVNAALARVWKSSLACALGFAGLAMAFAWGTHTVSEYSREAAVLAAPLCALLAIPFWMSFALHIARWKGYDPLIAAMGFVLAPIVFVGVGTSRVWTPISGYILLAALLLGPMFLILAPRRKDGVVKSPFRHSAAPQNWYMGNQKLIPWSED